MKVICVESISPFIKGNIYNVNSQEDGEGGKLLFSKELGGVYAKEELLDKCFREVEENMNDLTIEQKVKSLENQVKELKEQLHKQQENKKKWWTPEYTNPYLCVSNTGEILSDCWYNAPEDCNRYDIGNCFKTKEEANREIFERQLRFKLKKFAYENNEEEIDWNDEEQQKFSIYYKTKLNVLTYDFNLTGNHHGLIHFSSKDVVERAIETFKDDLIRYFTTDK